MQDFIESTFKKVRNTKSPLSAKQQKQIAFKERNFTLIKFKAFVGV